VDVDLYSHGQCLAYNHRTQRALVRHPIRVQQDGKLRIGPAPYIQVVQLAKNAWPPEITVWEANKDGPLTRQRARKLVDEQLGVDSIVCNWMEAK